MSIDVYRSEEKFVVPMELSLRIQEDMQKLLQADAYAADGEYIVRSLYFDSYNEEDYYDKVNGAFSHKKIRLRIYGNSDDGCIKLECKEKEGEYQHKQSVVVRKEDVEAIENGDFGFLLDDPDPTRIKIYKILTMGVYRPKTLVEYERRAFVYDEYNTRITFDSRIRCCEEYDIFENNPDWQDINPGEVVLEVKYNEKLIEPIRKVLKKYGIVKSAFSKYECGVDKGLLNKLY